MGDGLRDRFDPKNRVDKYAKQIVFVKQLTKFKDTQNCILIYDKVLQSKSISKWIRSFPNRYAVNAGETLKDTKNFDQHISKIIKLSKVFRVGI